jgi:CRISPR-associated protein (TIGR03984 family)
MLEDVELGELLRLPAIRHGLDGATAIVSTPDRCLVGRVDAGALEGPNGEALPLEDAFEVRAFTVAHDLRWTQTADGGRVLVVSEREGTGVAEPEVIEVELLGEQRYLLNGLRDEARSTPGWTMLSASHVASISIPFTTSEQRVQLVAVEYIRRDPEHGNVFVCEERLVTLVAGG